MSREIDVSSDEPILETTLIRDGMYCGRRFILAGYSLIFFAEEGQIKLYGPLHKLERSELIQQFLHSTDQRHAA